MSNRQLKSPNLAIVGQSGWCLAYVTEVFGIAPHYPSAISAWQNASFKHTEQPPGDVSVPVFFSYNGPYGHVAVSVPGRGIWSTSSQGDKVFSSVHELVSWMGEGFVYLGWSEDLNNVRVSEPAPAAPPRTPADYMQYVPAPYNMSKRTNKNPTKWWNLNNDSGNIDNFHPADMLDLHKPFTVGGYAINSHFPQYRYAMTPEDFGRAVNGNYSTNNGINEADLEDIPPEPVYVPPAAPVKAEPAETYDVITKLMVFPTAPDAKALSNYTGTDLEPGRYFVFQKSDNAYNLSTSNVDNQNRWVRITDNKVPVERVPAVPQPTEVSQLIQNMPVLASSQPTLPTDAPATDITLPVDPPLPTPITDVTTPAVKPQYLWIREDRLPVRLTSTNSIPVTIADMEGKWPTQPFPAHRTEEYSMYTVVKGKEYWLPDRTRQKGYMYGLSVDFLPDEQPKATLLDHNANGRYDVIDIFDNGISGLVDYGSKYLDGLKKAVTTVGPKIEPVRQRVSKTIDGFSAKRKK